MNITKTQNAASDGGPGGPSGGDGTNTNNFMDV